MFHTCHFLQPFPELLLSLVQFSGWSRKTGFSSDRSSRLGPISVSENVSRKAVSSSPSTMRHCLICFTIFSILYIWSIILKLYHYWTTRAKKVKGNSFWYLLVLKFQYLIEIAAIVWCFDTWFVFIYIFNYPVVASISNWHMNILLIQTNKLSDNSSGTSKPL